MGRGDRDADLDGMQMSKLAMGLTKVGGLMLMYEPEST
jgi:hypothetical protein